MNQPLTAIRQRLEAVADWLSSAGLGMTWLERLLVWWRQFGVVPTLALVLAVVIPTAKFVVIPQLASMAASTWAEGYGVELEVEDWGASVFDLSASAYDVNVRVAGPYLQQEILKAREVSVDLSLWRRIRFGSWLGEVSVVQPQIYLQRLNSGAWNWRDMISAPSELSTRNPFEENPYFNLIDADDNPATVGSLSFYLPRIGIEDLELQWVEDMPANSGGGLVQTQRSTLFLDDLQIEIRELAGPVDPRDRPSRFLLEGRTGDGLISLKGEANLFEWSRSRSLSGDAAHQPVSTVVPVWSPSLGLVIYLENVGAAAVGRMVPLTTLVPVDGRMTGTIQVDVKDGQVLCRTDVTMQNVAYGVNPASPGTRGQARQLQYGLEDFRSNRQVIANCDGDLDNPNYRPHYAAQAAITMEGVSDAGPSVRSAAAWDHRRLSGQIADESLNLLSAQLTAQAQRRLNSASPVLGNAFSTAVEGEGEGDNAVTGGLKGLGRGIKGLFGGNKDKKKN